MQVKRKKQNKRQRCRERCRRVVTVEQRNSKPTKNEFQVVRWVKAYFKMNSTRFLNPQGQFFSSSNLVDRLLDSGFAMGTNCALLTNCEEVADFLHLMMAHEFFQPVMITQLSLQLHPDQMFIDDPGEFYVWTYEPL